MHDTAYRIGGLVIDAYLPSLPAKILEIGAQDVNGSLRDHSPRNAEYVGLDFEMGKGVDAVITGVNDWNVPDAHFDLVMASSVFEHDKTFWKTFIEMCRKVKVGGHIYINVPSNGAIHRYPKDYWRFYPDSGLALEELARSEGFDLTLIESFIAEREADSWNDFCAVFRRGPCDDVELNHDFIHDKVRCVNALNWRSSSVINPVDVSEDARLLQQARVDAQQAVLQADHLRVLLAEQERAWEVERAQLEAQITLRADQNVALVQKVEQQKTELGRLNAEVKAIVSEQENERANASAIQGSLKGQVDALKRQVDALNGQVNELSAQKSAADQRLHERFREIGGLTRMIQEREERIADGRRQTEWLCEVASVLTIGLSPSRKAWLAAWLPAHFSHQRQKGMLLRRGLFDFDAYKAAYPDVAASKANPLRHYIKHGILEGRVVK